MEVGLFGDVSLGGVRSFGGGVSSRYKGTSFSFRGVPNMKAGLFGDESPG